MFNRNKEYRPAAGVLLLALVALLVPMFGCSSDAAVSGLGFVEVSWTIKGKEASTTVCKDVGATRVRVRFVLDGASMGDAHTYDYDCDKAKVKHSAGADAKLDVVVELLGEKDAVLGTKKQSIKVKDEDTISVKVAFLSGTVDAGPDSGGDAGGDAGGGAAPRAAGADTGTPDTGTPDTGTPDQSAPDAATPDAATQG